MAMKWLRKHNKKILVVGGALLMLAFLMPQQRGCRGPRMPDRAVAEAFGRKIMLSEYYNGQMEHQLLRELGFAVPVADPLDYVLLLRETRQMRIPGGAEAVPEELATAIAQSHKVNNLGELAAKLSGQQGWERYRISEKLLRRTIGNFWAIKQAEQLILSSPREIGQTQGRSVPDFRSTLGLAQPSEKEVELEFRDVREMLDIGYVSLPGWRYASKAQAAGEAAIIAQFEAYKDQYPGTTDNEFGFGYKQRVLLRIEYIKADVEKIMAGLQEPAPAVLAEYYEKNKETYLLPAPEPKNNEGESAGQEGEKAEPVKQYKPFEDVYDELKSNWLKEKAQETALSMIAKARSLSRQRWEEMKKGQRNTGLDLAALYPYAGEAGENLVNQLVQEFKVVPEYQSTGWVDAAEAEKLAGIGRSYITTGQQSLGFIALAVSVRQNVVYQEDRAEDRQDFEVGQDCPFNLVDAQGNTYLFRVIGLQRDKVLSVEEMLANQKVRSLVAVDIARRKTYEYAKEQGQQLLELASQKGIKNGVKGLGEGGLEVRQTGLVAREDIKRSLQILQLPLVDEQGLSKGEIGLRWQDLSQFSRMPQPLGMLQINVTNGSDSGRITAVGLNLPHELRIFCPEIKNAYSATGAVNGGEAVPTDTQGYTLRYCGRGIEAGAAGDFDLLISADGQELVNTANLDKGGVEPGQSQTFVLALTHANPRLSTLGFVRNRNSEVTKPGGEGFNLVARLETSGKNQLLRGVFPANRQIEFLRPCFAVLDREGLIHQPSPSIISKENKTEEDAEQDKPDESAVRVPGLLIDSQTQQGPCVLIELPSEGLCYVGQVQKHLPLSREEFQQNRLAALNNVMSEQYWSLWRQWWDSNNIRLRSGYKPLGVDQSSPSEEQQDEEETSPDD